MCEAMREIRIDTACKIYGLFLLFVGLIAAIAGCVYWLLGGSWVLIPPAVLVLFVGRQYLRPRGESSQKRGRVEAFPIHGVSKRKGAPILMPAHGGRARAKAR